MLDFVHVGERTRTIVQSCPAIFLLAERRRSANEPILDHALPSANEGSVPWMVMEVVCRGDDLGKFRPLVCGVWCGVYAWHRVGR